MACPENWATGHTDAAVDFHVHSNIGRTAQPRHWFCGECMVSVHLLLIGPTGANCTTESVAIVRMRHQHCYFLLEFSRDMTSTVLLHKFSTVTSFWILSSKPHIGFIRL
uniref:Uncharacterized protein n=1 Tax=Arundo donax TaxID=35708 RepID=A0A0A9TCV4_ARUDO